MSLCTNLYASRTTPSGRIQIGHKSGLLATQAIRVAAQAIRIYLFSVNIKTPRHRFGLSLCLGLAILHPMSENTLNSDQTRGTSIKLVVCIF